MKSNRLLKLSTLLYCLVFSSLFSSPANAFDQKFNRNGEVYFLIGEQNEDGSPNPLKGIYRMNNPETNTNYKGKGGIYGDGVLYISDIDNTMGFTVDFDRNIYPFSENNPSNFTADTYMYRQVVDDVDWKQVDYGYHAYYHSDYRTWGKGTNIYRSDVNRASNKKIQNVAVTNFVSAGPGEESSLPEGYVFMVGSGKAKVPIKPGKKWYKIKNNSWYSCWNTGSLQSGKTNVHSKDSSKNLNYFFWTVGDKETSKIHKYYVNKWGDSEINNHEFSPNYQLLEEGSSQVGQTYEVRVQREARAGCLDSCGNASGNASASATLASASVAFQPKMKNSDGQRSYFYTRMANSTDYSLKMNGTEVDSSVIIGKPADKTTNWIGISLKDSGSDYIYALGTNVIKDWYKQATTDTLSNMNITAVAVSNQWNQKGGIVFAYDAANEIVYKFTRNDKEGSMKYEGISCSDLAKSIGGVNAKLDDIKADGFGSLYFGLSYPAKSSESFDPRKYFKPEKAVYLTYVNTSNEGKQHNYEVLFEQEYGKAVFQKDYLSGVTTEVGARTYAYKYYNVAISLTKGCVASMGLTLDRSSVCPSNWLKAMKVYYEDSNDPDKELLYVGSKCVSDVNKLEEDMFSFGVGHCSNSLYSSRATVNENEPGLTQLAVINVPTPDEPRHLGLNNRSYLDICGPYVNYPTPDASTKTTGQGRPEADTLNLTPKKTYFYMVENYPLDTSDGTLDPQDPTTTPDCDEDTRTGGFISSIKKITYKWKCWMVRDPFGEPCCDLYDESNSYNYPIWYYGPSQFILTCSAKYDWYNYDRLSFGDTIDDKESVLETNKYALPSKEGSFPRDGIAGSGYKDYIQTLPTSVFDKENPTTVLTNIMKNNASFTFMLASSSEYISKIISGDDKDYLAIVPISFDGKTPSTSSGFSFRAKIERCDDLSDYSYAAKNYIYKDSYWNYAPSDTNCFTIEEGNTHYWRMAVASQAKFFCDISKNHNIDKNKIDDSDFNLVAYLLSTEKIDGADNDQFINKDEDLRFYPNEDGSCFWVENAPINDGNPAHVASWSRISVETLLDYPLPNGDIKTVQLTKKTDIDFLTTDTWQNQIKPIYATMSKELNIPPTDPFVGTITIRLERKYSYVMWILEKGVRRKAITIKNIPFTLEAVSSIRVLDTKAPKIVYNETNPTNIYGLTGLPLAESYTGQTKTNPATISFALSDNNVWESGSEKGLSLSQHIENYYYNFGDAACKKYTDGSNALTNFYLQAKAKIGSDYVGLRNEILSKKQNKKPSSSINLKPLFSKAARDVRFEYESSGLKKTGQIVHEKANNLVRYTGTVTDTYDNGAAGSYDLFSGDYSHYAYNTGVNSLSLTNSYLSLVNDAITQINGVDCSKANYAMGLEYIRLSNGSNIVPMSYANNTAGYKPYQFYIGATDCSGNFTITNKDEKGAIPLNMVVTVKDDIPPIPYGVIIDSKTGTTKTIPQEVKNSRVPFINPEMYPKDDNGNILTPVTPQKVSGLNIASYSIVTKTSDNIPAYVGSLWNKDFLRQKVWISDSKKTNGYIIGSGNSFKTLLSLSPDETNFDNIEITHSSNGKLENATLKAQVNGNVSPGYIEDSVTCTFKVFASDNAGNSIATLSFKALNSYKQTSNSYGGSYITAGYSVNATYTNEINGNNINKLSSTKFEVGECYARFVAPTQWYPLIIPIMITAEDNARDWDEYGGFDPSKTNPWTSVTEGAPASNTRRINTSLVVLGSETDVRTLDKTLRNEQ